MRKLIVIGIILLFLGSSIPALASSGTTALTVSKLNEPKQDGIWLQSGSVKLTSNDTWFHYDDGTCEQALGFSKRDAFWLHEIIKLTPEELDGFNGTFDQIKVMHGCPLYPGAAWPENYSAWMYTGTDHPTTPHDNTTTVASGFCDVLDDYFYINLTNPYPFQQTDTVWIGVAWDAPIGSYPAGFDTDTYTPFKGDWLWFDSGTWYELGQIGEPGNWCLEVHVTNNDTTPPVTNCTITGTNPVTITLTATDYESGVAYTKYSLDNGSWTTYTTPFTVSAPGWHTLSFYSVDNAGNIELTNTRTFYVPTLPTITIQGGLGITVSIHNGGDSDYAFNCSVNLTGLVFPKSKFISSTVSPGATFRFKEMVLGYGKITITAVVNDNTVSKDATVLLILVLM